MNGNRWAAFAAAGIVLVTGCSHEQEATAPTTSGDLLGIDQSIATTAVEGAGETIQMMNPGGAPRPFLGDFPARIPEGCDYDAGSGRFNCAPVTHENGPTFQRSYAFLDGAGGTQSAYDAATTAAINFHGHVSGVIERERTNGMVDDQRDLTASGLAGNETTWTWNGSGSGTSHEEGLFGPPPGRGRPDAAHDPVPMQVDITRSMTVDNVVVPYPPAKGSWPLSGSITQTMSAKISGGPHDGETRGGTAVLTFNGTQYATLTIGDETRTIDLSRPPGPPHRGDR